MKFLRFLLLACIGAIVAIWLVNMIWLQFVLPAKLNTEIGRCREGQDPAVAIRILEAALVKYPQAPNRPVAEQLLKTKQTQLDHTRELVKILDEVKNNPQLSNAVIRLQEGMDTYFEATNHADARRVLTGLRGRLAETERLALAIQYAKQSDDAAYGVGVLSQTLAESPNAANRKEAEDLLASKKKQKAALETKYVE